MIEEFASLRKIFVSIMQRVEPPVPWLSKSATNWNSTSIRYLALWIILCENANSK